MKLQIPTKEIKVCKDFSKFPAGRFKTDGQTSGEAFRERYLKDNLNQFDEIIINLDGVAGYGSSFLEEAFGGLVRVEGFTAEALKEKIRFVSEDPTLEKEIWDYVDDAEKE